MSLLESVRNNEKIDLHLCDAIDEIIVGDKTTSNRRTTTSSSRALDEFLKVLQGNTSIESIHLEKDFMGDLRHDCREKLLYALGRVQSLKELTLADALLQVRHISAMIQDAKSLRFLRLQNIVLQGVKSDFDECEEIIHSHDSTITKLEVVDCTAAIASLSLQGLSKDSTGSGRQKLVNNVPFVEDDMITPTRVLA